MNDYEKEYQFLMTVVAEKLENGELHDEGVQALINKVERVYFLGFQAGREQEEKYSNYKESNVNHPTHYQGKTEVIDIIEQGVEGLQGLDAFCMGNVIKYVMRHGKKGGKEDLEKASWYLNKVIEGDGQDAKRIQSSPKAEAQA
ncbi:DUF3310 domain-containing protein [Sediminibacillus massiliensis]|uniref:DUF3310 domain-containing protein n=1 Tax=Sediminibacillus massiliensis TaxID=1926277 RepID=UPI001C4DE3DA|nr:DUF3310 domain-containing protein [Sediminibacillus massiliensis]